MYGIVRATAATYCLFSDKMYALDPRGVGGGTDGGLCEKMYGIVQASRRENLSRT